MKNVTHISSALCISLLLVACRINGIPTPEPLTVDITSPANNATVPVGKPAQIVTSASGPDGIARIELSINGTLVAVSNNPTTTSPYQAIISYTPMNAGPLNLIVRAYDQSNTASTPAGLTLQAVASEQPTASATSGTPAPPSPTQTPQITPTTVPGIAGPGGCVLNAQFIADLTVPDGTTVPLNGSFTKTWRVRNTGTCKWDATYKLVFAAGSQLGATGSVPLNPTDPGEVTDINVPMQAPASGTGTLAGEWRFAAPDNTIFGNKLTVVIALPVPTATPQPTVTVPPPTPTGAPTADFSTDNTTILKGSCTTLKWSTSNVAGVFLDGSGVPSPATKSVCPTEATTYTLRISLNDGSNITRQVVVSVSSGTVVYSFADNAPSAHWYNEISQTLPFGGPDTDNRGFAMNRDGSTLEDGSLQLKVMETHPHWVTGGSVSGEYDVPTALQNGDRFRTRIGFLKDATSGAVTLRVWFKGVVVSEISKAYSATLKDWDIDLSSFAGQSGKFTLQVVGAPSATTAWICWINPRIER